MPEMTYHEYRLLQAQNNRIEEQKAEIERLKAELAAWKAAWANLAQKYNEDTNSNIPLEGPEGTKYVFVDDPPLPDDSGKPIKPRD